MLIIETIEKSFPQVWAMTDVNVQSMNKILPDTVIPPNSRFLGLRK